MSENSTRTGTLAEEGEIVELWFSSNAKRVVYIPPVRFNMEQTIRKKWGIESEEEVELIETNAFAFATENSPHVQCFLREKGYLDIIRPLPFVRPIEKKFSPKQDSQLYTQAQLDEAVANEREECAKFAEWADNNLNATGIAIAAGIRARGSE